MFKRILLGPQHPDVNLGAAIANGALPDGPIAVISAGWQEAEGDLEHVNHAVQRHLVDLRLYQRAEEIFAARPELRALYRERQDALKAQQRLYIERLRHLMVAARAMLRADGDAHAVAVEQRHAILQLRTLDRHHLRRVQKIAARYNDKLALPAADLVKSHVEAIAKTLEKCPTVMLTGGNVLVLLNRLRLFGVERLLADKHIVAWSAGAMVLSDVVVLFHDKMPQGHRNPEVMEAGIGLLPGYIFLPDATRRLRERDQVRIGLFSRRFSPAACVTLDSGTMITFEGNRRAAVDGARRMSRTGKLKIVRLT